MGRDPVHGPLLNLIFKVVFAHDLDIHAVLARGVTLLLEKDGGVPETVHKYTRVIVINFSLIRLIEGQKNIKPFFRVPSPPNYNDLKIDHIKF